MKTKKEIEQRIEGLEIKLKTSYDDIASGKIDLAEYSDNSLEYKSKIKVLEWVLN